MKCTNCNHDIDLSSFKDGKELRCPNCQALIRMRRITSFGETAASPLDGNIFELLAAVYSPEILLDPQKLKQKIVSSAPSLSRTSIMAVSMFLELRGPDKLIGSANSEQTREELLNQMVNTYYLPVFESSDVIDAFIDTLQKVDINATKKEEEAVLPKQPEINKKRKEKAARTKQLVKRRHLIQKLVIALAAVLILGALFQVMRMVKNDGSQENITKEEIEGNSFSNMTLSKKDLEKIFLSKQESLEFENCTFEEIPDIQENESLKSLTINNCEGLSDLGFLSKLKNLSGLSLPNDSLTNKILKTADFKELHNLTTLNLSQNKLTSLDSIKDCSNLVRLNAASNELKDMNGIRYLAHLRVMNLPDNEISQFESLQSRSESVYLNLSRNQISQIQSSECYFEWLDLASNPITYSCASALSSCSGNILILSADNNPFTFADRQLSLTYQPLAQNQFQTLAVLADSEESQNLVASSGIYNLQFVDQSWIEQESAEALAAMQLY